MAEVTISGITNEETEAAADSLIEMETGAGVSGKMSQLNLMKKLIGNLNTNGFSIGDASSGKVSLTDDMEITGADPRIRLDPSGGGASYSEIDDVSAAQLKINKVTVTGTALLDLNPIPSDGSGNAQVRIFRDTNTTGTKNTQWFKGDGGVAVHAQVGVDGGDSFFQTGGGKVLIGTTANGSMSQGLTIDQNANDNEALTIMSTGDVDHGMTAIAGTSVYEHHKKVDAAAGGALIRGFRDADGTFSGAMVLEGILGETASTVKSTTAGGVVEIRAQVKSGTGATMVGVDGNLLTIRNDITTRFIFDAEGSAHADIEWTTFDTFDDVAIIKDLEATLVPGVFGKVVKHNKAFFQKIGILNDVREENGKMRGMLNQTKLTMLLTGAISQLSDRIALLEGDE